jgi:hypothetical protein
MPTHFRWLWYLVGLAGMALSVIGILAILGSAAELGILVPLVVGGAIVIGYAVIRFRRSLHAAVAAAPSRQPGATPQGDALPEPESATPTSETSTSAAEPKKAASGPARTSRR